MVWRPLAEGNVIGKDVTALKNRCGWVKDGTIQSACLTFIRALTPKSLGQHMESSENLCWPVHWHQAC